MGRSIGSLIRAAANSDRPRIANRLAYSSGPWEPVPVVNVDRDDPVAVRHVQQLSRRKSARLIDGAIRSEKSLG